MNSQSVLDASFKQAIGLLDDFSTNSNFEESIAGIFGSAFDRDQLSAIQDAWQLGEMTNIPSIQMLSSNNLKGANAAFSSTTNTIYISENFLANNVGNPSAITSVLLEEIGHFVDSQINATDTPGDEGAIFAAVVQGQPLSPDVLSVLRAENDAITILTPAGLVSAEASVASAANLKFIGDYIDDALDAVLGTLASAGIDKIDLPLLGKFNLASYVSNFVNQTLKQGLINEIQAAAGAGTDAVRQAMFQALGSSGLGLLLESDGQAGITVNDILLPDSLNSTEFKFKIGKSFKEFIDLGTDLGISGLGLNINGKANVNLDLSLDLDFGVDESVGSGSFFLKTSGTDELKAQISVNLNDENGNPLSFDGTLGFLNTKITDNGTNFNAGLKADLKTSSVNADRVRITDFVDLSITTPAPNSGANLKLKIDTGLSTDGTNKNGMLPSIQADFEALNVLGAKSSIAFKNVTLDAGGFVRDFAGDVLESVKKVTEPISPVIKIIDSPLPVINNSLLDLAKQFPIPGSPVDQDTLDFIKQIGKIIDLVNAIPTGNQAGLIKLGDFEVTGNANTINQSQAPTQSIADQLLGIDSIPAGKLASNAKAASSLGSFFTAYNDSGFGSALAFPILNEPFSVIKLLLGDPTVELFNYTTPALKFGLKYDAPPIPIFGPVSITFGGKASVSAQLKFGFDSKGLSDFKASGFKNPEKIFDGFYASRPTPTGANISLIGELTAEAGVNIGFASVGVGGGIRLTNNLSLFDKSDVFEPFKVRGSAIASKSPTCLFLAEGTLEAFIFANLEIDLGFFSISKRLNLADINLIDVKADPDCPGQKENEYDKKNADKSPELKALLKSQGVISYEDIDGNNRIIFEHTGGVKNDENINLILQEGTPNQTIDRYSTVKSILVEGRSGDDYIEFRGGVEAFGDVQGNDGNDTIITGKGNDFLSGGQGNDSLDGGAGKNYATYSDSPNRVVVNLQTGRATQDGYGTQDILRNIQNLEGSGFNDNLTGDNNANVLDGGAGNDVLNGLGGDDVFLSGAGADRMDGGSGTDTITFLGSRDHVYINLSNQDVNTFSEFDNLPFDLAANSGYGADADGDQFFRFENVQGSIYDDVLVAGENGGKIDGFQGNDFIIAGSGSDEFVASEGIDWLSYRLSNAGVEFSLQTGDGLGGFAEDDKIIQARFKGVDQSERFENLEGSNFDDALLEGDDNDNFIRGLAGSDTLSGLGGNDLLEGGLGSDFINGGSDFGRRANTDEINGGGDTATYQNATSGISVNLNGFGLGFGSSGEAAGDILVGIENLIGSNYGDNLTGDAGDNDLNPMLGSGLYGEASETDIVDGGAGRDRLTLIDYDRNDEGLGLTGGFTNVATGSGRITRGADTVEFSNIERLLVVGTGNDDNLTGGVDRDVFLMGAGNDTVNGGGRDDFLDGDDGIDTLSADFSFTYEDITLIGDDSKENQGVNLAGSNGLFIQRFEIFKDITTGSGYGNDTLIQKGRVDNKFYTGSGDDYVDAGLGIDLVDGGYGNGDLLTIDYSVGDTGSGITTALNEGVNTISRNIAEDSGTILDEITFYGFESLYVIGTSKVDLIKTSSSNDYLLGMAGDDVIESSYGNDYIDGGEGDDVLAPGGVLDFDFVDGGNNTVVGDLLYLDYSSDSTAGVRSIVLSSAGSNSGNFYRAVISDGPSTLLDEVRFMNIERFDITGTRQSDQIDGGSGDDRLVGGFGNDVLTGGAGDDILIGNGTKDAPIPNRVMASVFISQEFDKLIGGAGADTFWVGFPSTTSALTLVTDFSATENDKIRLDGSLDLYTFGTSPDSFNGVGIYRKGYGSDTLIGIVRGTDITEQSVISGTVFS
jgi:Ca2+-binding RTX toxin-like protein